MEVLKSVGKIIGNILIQIVGVILFLAILVSDEYGRWYYANAFIDFFEQIFK